MKTKVFTIILCMYLLSCTEKITIEDVLYTDSNEYWQYYTGQYYGPSYIKFHKNNTSNNVSIEDGKFINRNPAGNPAKWSISKDSILTWDINKFDIVEYNDKVVILYNQGKDGSDGKIVSGFIYLVKGTIYNVSREPGYYAYKRELHPEKYRKQ